MEIIVHTEEDFYIHMALMIQIGGQKKSLRTKVLGLLLNWFGENPDNSFILDKEFREKIAVIVNTTPSTIDNIIAELCKKGYILHVRRSEYKLFLARRTDKLELTLDAKA